MALARHQFTVVDASGNIVPSASVEVRSESSGLLAQLYSDRAGTTPIGNPFNADANGFASFYVAGGAYKIEASAGSSSLAPWRYVGIGLLGERDALAAADIAFDPTGTGLASVTTQTALAELESDLADLDAVANPAGFASGMETFLNAPSSANLAATLTDETGSGLAVFGTRPTITAPVIVGRTPTSATVTIANGANANITWTSHGLTTAAPIFFETTGALPTGLMAAVKSSGAQISPFTYKSNPTLYYAIIVDANTIRAATSIANALAGTAVTTSSAGSGTHTAFANAAVPSGCVGELIYKYIEIGSGVSASNGGENTWIQMDVTAGLWLVGGIYGIYGNSGSPIFGDWHATVGYSVSGGFLTITSPYGGINAAHLTTNQSNGIVFPFGQQPFVLTSNTTISSAAKVNWTNGGTALHYGGLWALRIG